MSSGEMGRLVDDITTLSRSKDPGFLEPVAIDLERFVADVASKAEPLLNGRLRVGSVPTGARMLADPGRLTEVLLNLLQNAASHAKGTGPVDLRVRAEPGWWRFEVADTGRGLPPGEEERLFRGFEVGRSTSSGTGLGLAIVRGIAQAHGGTAGVANHPGRGATFWVRVPR